MVDYDNKEKALVYIETNRGTGSGFMITADGLCFTCNHVVDGAEEIFVRLINGKNEKIVCKAEVKYADADEDYAILQVCDLDSCYYYKLETHYDSLSAGDDVAVYGFPFGADLNEDVMALEPSLAKGYIASKNTINGRTCYFLDIRSAPGNSGGPVFSIKSEKVIGYLCGSYGNSRSDIIYIRTLKTFIDKLV